MKLSNFCGENLISFVLKAETKGDVITELVELVANSKFVKDPDRLLKDIQGTTGVGLGLAFPYAMSEAVKGIVIAFGRSEKGINFDSMDKELTHLFFLVLAPKDAIEACFKVKGTLSYITKSSENRDKLMKFENSEDVLNFLDSVIK